MSLVVGEIVEGVVTGITNFGAFVQLPTGQTGLVHISEVADTYVENIHDYVKMNDKVRVKILSVDPDGKRIGLSIRQAQPGFDPNRPRGRRGPGRGGGRRDASFEEKLKQFLKESDAKLADLRKHEGRRNRGGRSW